MCCPLWRRRKREERKMGSILQEIGNNCTGVDQDPNIGADNCDFNLNNWYSTGFLDKNGTDFLNNNGLNEALTDKAALKARIETASTFTAALASSGRDRLSFAPKVTSVSQPANINEDIERANGTIGQSEIYKRNPITIKYVSPSSNLEEYLYKFKGNSRKFFIVLPNGNFVFKKLTDAEVADGEDPFFDAEQVKVGVREFETGSTNEDYVPMMITTKYDELVKVEVFNTSSFGLSLVDTPIV